MHPYINIATMAARRAGHIITRAFDYGDRLKVSLKSENDYVTEVDKRAEEAIIDEIRKANPEHSILAEESGASGNGDVQWIIDPLDGTANFIHNIPHVAISIAVKVEGRIEHGVIYDPFRDELFTASRGKGAQLNQKKLRITRKDGLDNAMLATAFPFRNKQLTPQYIHAFQTLFPVVSDMRRCGAAALDLAYVAAGRFDGYWEWGLSIWDIAAGCLLVREAGGMVCDIDGSENYLTTGNIMAGNSRLLKEMLPIFK